MRHWRFGARSQQNSLPVTPFGPIHDRLSLGTNLGRHLSPLVEFSVRAWLLKPSRAVENNRP